MFISTERLPFGMDVLLTVEMFVAAMPHAAGEVQAHAMFTFTTTTRAIFDVMVLCGTKKRLKFFSTNDRVSFSLVSFPVAAGSRDVF